MNVAETLQIACGQTYLIKTIDDAYIEAGDVFMAQESGLGTRPYRFEDFDQPSDLNKRVMTVSTMAGCPCACTFCASRKSFKRNLGAYEIVQQVLMMIEEGKKHGRDPDPNNAAEFRVLFTRMGEPMLNAKNVIEAIRRLISMFPKIIIGMSTSGYKKGLDMFLEATDILPHIEMQFSLHATMDRERDTLFGTTSNLSISGIAHYARKWYAATKKKVSLNCILFDDYTYNFIDLLEFFTPEEIWIRLSPWNVVEDVESKFRSVLKTADVIDKKPITSERLQRIIENLEYSGFAYSYAPAIDEEIKHNVACGQALAAFKNKIK